MPTRNISLTVEQDAFVESIVKAGEYQNANEALGDALRVLQQQRQEDALKLEALRAQVKAGIDELDRGDYIEVDDAELGGFLEGLDGAMTGVSGAHQSPSNKATANRDRSAIQVYRVTISKDQFRTLPPEERALVLILGHALNQIGVFVKLVRFSSNKDFIGADRAIGQRCANANYH